MLVPLTIRINDKGDYKGGMAVLLEALLTSEKGER